MKINQSEEIVKNMVINNLVSDHMNPNVRSYNEINHDRKTTKK